MKDYVQRHTQIAVHLLLIALAIIIGTMVSEYNQNRIQAEVTTRLFSQFDYMYELASITDRNGADEAIASIVADCGRRQEFESLLIKLDSLTKKDLITVQNLYDNCGNFYAERKALMVSKLERELQIYSDLVSLLSIFDSNAEDVSNLTTWRDLVEKEKTRSTLLHDQSIFQQKIITLLISGSTKESKDVGILAHNAQETWDLLGVSDSTIDVLRESLKR